MGRPKHITDEVLLHELDKFYLEYCKSDKSMLTIPKFGRYLRSAGYENVQDHTIRRHKCVRERLSQLKENARQSLRVSVAVFDPVDLVFVRRNLWDWEKISSYLRDRDDYFKLLQNSVLQCMDEADQILQQRDDLIKEIADLKRRNEEILFKEKKAKSENGKLKDKIRRLEGFINANVKTDIAALVLDDLSIPIQCSGVVDKEKANRFVIDVDSDVHDELDLENELLEELIVGGE